MQSRNSDAIYLRKPYIAAYKRSALNVTDANLPQRMDAEIIRMGLGGELVAHGMKSIARTAAEESGKFRTEVLEAALAHSKKDEIIAAYNRAEYLPLSCSGGAIMFRLKNTKLSPHDPSMRGKLS